MTLLLEMFTYPFIVRAFAAGVLLSLCAALLGVPLVLKRYSMIGDGLSHVSFGALSVAVACGWAPLPVSIPVVVLAALGLLPENAKKYASRIDLAIDHHPSNEGFAKENCVLAEMAACGEIIYEIVGLLTPMTAEIALPLYVAVSTDTGCFVYANTTAHTHQVAAALIDTGIAVAGVNKALFRTKSRTRLAMEAWMAEWAEYYDNDRVVIMQIPLSLRQELHATDADIEELSALAAQVEGTDCGVTLRELRPGTVKLSLRTGPRVNATEVCRLLGGGGHAAAAGATVSGTMAQAKSAVLAAIAQVIGPLAP